MTQVVREAWGKTEHAGATRKLATWVAGLRYEDLPDVVVAVATGAILDSVGVILAGLGETVTETMFGWVAEQGGAPGSTVIGRGTRTTPSLAALANGVAGHALDFGSINLSLAGFISMPFAPAVLALGEAHHRSGREVLTAFVVGTEVAAKLGRGLNMHHYDKGWHPTATLGTLGAAAAAANLLRLTPEQTTYALGIAGSEAAGLKCNIGTMTLPYHTAKAGRNGIVAAELAGRGYEASTEMLEAPYGFCELFNGAGNYDLRAVTDQLGAPFDIVDPGVVHKPYACCGLVHSALDALVDLRADPAYDPDAIKEVRVGLHYLVPRVMSHDEPATGYEAKFSLPYCIALGAAYGRPALDDFRDERLADERIRRLMPKVSYYVHPELTAFESIDWEFSDVVVRLGDGRELHRRVARAENKGSPANPLTDAELDDKFRECAGRALPGEQVGRALRGFRGLADADDVGSLLAGLTAPAVSAERIGGR